MNPEQLAAQCFALSDAAERWAFSHALKLCMPAADYEAFNRAYDALARAAEVAPVDRPA